MLAMLPVNNWLPENRMGAFQALQAPQCSGRSEAAGSLAQLPGTHHNPGHNGGCQKTDQKKERSHFKHYTTTTLLKWLGYGPAHNTWEPEKNLINCSEVLQALQCKDSAPKAAGGPTFWSSMKTLAAMAAAMAAGSVNSMKATTSRGWFSRPGALLLLLRVLRSETPLVPPLIGAVLLERVEQLLRSHILRQVLHEDAAHGLICAAHRPAHTLPA